MTPDDVIAFWLDEPRADGAVPEAVQGRWWKKDPELDETIRQRFGEAVRAAVAGELVEWTETPQGTLALIIVLDQFTRNIFRDTGAMFAGDARARGLTRRLLDGGGFESLRPVERYFALMPLMHSEEVPIQQEAVARFEAEAERAPDAARKLFDNGALFARKHAVIVERFGRFPHRNALLGRTSTSEELAFLETPGSSF
ncbi:MAG: DUF924 domain-containing protein [Deltaproteobacteria bacterium]|nr:DUF924 domain-containing protein [Deltaproteobacteria bacterium]